VVSSLLAGKVCHKVTNQVRYQATKRSTLLPPPRRRQAKRFAWLVFGPPNYNERTRPAFRKQMLVTTIDTPDAVQEAARAVERLRLSEARLSRRRQTDCGPSENARAAMRYILERADDGEAATPSEIAQHVGVSAASVTGMLDRLHAGGLISFEANPRDRRSKLVVPFDRSIDLADVDPLTARIRDYAEKLSDEEARHVAEFLDLVRRAVDEECA
jgi:DNA-binding MarR family transcriptional regulator